MDRLARLASLTPAQRLEWARIADAMRQHNQPAAARLEFWRLYQSRIELNPRESQ